jgi:Fe-S-cluster containining protein
MLFHWCNRERRRGILLDRPLEDPERCRRCDGACCRAFSSVPLTWPEYETLKSLGARRLEFSLSGHHLLMIEDGCEFLLHGRCAIYPQRPDVCRRFYCYDC